MIVLPDSPPRPLHGRGMHAPPVRGGGLFLREKIVRARRYRLLGSFLPGPVRRASVALSAMLLFGCTSAAKRVATHQNSYDFREARYEEACVVATPPSECIEAFGELRAYEKHLHEAAKALKNGGGLPLQLQAIDADGKKLAKRGVAK